MIELFEAHGMLVRDNVFGVNQRGGAQLYLALRSDNVDVVDNLFMRTDRRAPGITPRIGILVGTRHSLRAPHHVRIINDTVLSGRAWRARTAESIVLGPHYGRIPAADRPVIANTVLARMADPRIVCPRAGALVDDVLATGSGGRRGVVVGDPALTPKGEPTSGSTLLIDQASATYAPARDLLGHRRVGPPDIGCFEYLP
jgi:hypothetical protein